MKQLKRPQRRGEIIYIIYSKQGCINCERAKALLLSKRIEFEVKMAGVDYDVEDLRRLGVRQLPFITEDDGESWGVERRIGGLEELKKELF